MRLDHDRESSGSAPCLASSACNGPRSLRRCVRRLETDDGAKRLFPRSRAQLVMKGPGFESLRRLPDSDVGRRDHQTC
jgi:hypothetical protein